MERPWYKNVVIYAVNVRTFQDSNGDGWGDLPGLTSRLDYLRELGITCLWVQPFYCSPFKDNGYDIADYYRIDERFGTFDDLADLLAQAHARNIRVVLDLVMNHTSDEHPWFLASARDPNARFRDYYVWAAAPQPVPPGQRTIFPGVTSGVWSYNQTADAYYYHRFYAFQPELHCLHPEVRQEILKVLDFWLAFGVDGFRIDAASHMIEHKGTSTKTVRRDHTLLKQIYQLVENRRAAPFLLAEADVQLEHLDSYFGAGDEMTLLLNFLLSEYLFLAFATQEVAALERLLSHLPERSQHTQWANFLRNLDELDLERLTEADRQKVYAAFAPQPTMRAYERGIRRRLAPMLDGDRQRLELAWSLLFALPGVPIINYGDEIGMGDDLALPERDAVRTPMQWDASANAGFSSAPADQLVHPLISSGRFDYHTVNVQAQAGKPDSFLTWMQRLIALRHEHPELGWCEPQVLECDDPHVLAHLCRWQDRTLLLAHNLADQQRQPMLTLPDWPQAKVTPIFGAQEHSFEDGHLALTLPPYGYMWLRLTASEK